MDLAVRLRDLRLQAGMTKTALARPRYTVSYVSQIEAGKRTPSPEALSFFAAQVGVSPHFLATGIPDGIEDEMRYRLEEARGLLREGHGRDAEGIAHDVVARAGEFQLAAVVNEGSLVAAEALTHQGKLPQAIDTYEQSLAGGLPDRDLARATVGLARAYRMVGDLNYAAQLVEAFLDRSDRAPLDPAVAAELQSVLVSVYFERGDVVRAERAAERALAAAAGTGSLELRAKTYWGASRVLAERKRWREALDFATRARTLMEELGDRESVSRLHTAYAFICLEADPPRVEEAGEHLDRAEALLAGEAASAELAYILEERGRVALLLDRHEEALEWARRALAEANPDGLETARCLFLEGRALSLLGRGAEARASFRAAADLFGRLGARQQEASCWRELGELDLSEGDLPAAVESLRAGLQALEPHRTRA
jgi:tetratricopeptide (TPR) repeat protein